MTKEKEPASEMIPPAPKDEYPPVGYSWYVVGILTVAYVFSFIDRQILNLLVGPIRRDLQISDTEMSLLMGFSFAVFYTFFGIPLGRLADTRSRRALITGGIVLWSLMTAACGLARNFVHFLLLRMGVGVGEAALSPSAYSLIADYFPRENRATALSVYSMGIYIGSGLAYLLGGLVVKVASAQERLSLPIVGETRPWQVVFFVVGFAGVLFSVFMFSVREPVRKGLRMARGADGKETRARVTLRETIDYLKANKVTFICHNLGFALLSFSSYGSTAWIPEFFIRKHGWTSAQVGVVYGTIIMVFGALGIVFGGKLADWMVRRGYRDANMRVGMIAAMAWLPTGVLYPLMPDGNLAAALLAPTTFLVSMPFGVSAAAIQEMMPNEMRGQASATYLFVVNLIGLGLGPTAVAMMTDYVFRDDNMVNYSLLVVAAFAHAGSALLLWLGLKPYLNSLARLTQWTKVNG
jgi:MFS family permease